MNGSWGVLLEPTKAIALQNFVPHEDGFLPSQRGLNALSLSLYMGYYHSIREQISSRMDSQKTRLGYLPTAAGPWRIIAQC
jgi:hypothetical protein